MLYDDIACFIYNCNMLGASWNHILKNVRVGRMPQNCNVMVHKIAGIALADAVGRMPQNCNVMVRAELKRLAEESKSLEGCPRTVM